MTLQPKRTDNSYAGQLQVNISFRMNPGIIAADPEVWRYRIEMLLDGWTRNHPHVIGDLNIDVQEFKP